MKLRKGLSCVAFGFLFTLVSVNLNFSEQSTLDLFPDFVGWLLFLLAYNQLLRYTAEKPVLKWLPLPMLLYSGAVWLMDLNGSPLDIGLLSVIPLFIQLFYMYTLFGCLERLAADHAPDMAPRIRTLRNLNLGLAILLALFSYLAYAMQSDLLTLPVFIGAFIALAVAVYTCVTLFKLRSRVPE